MEDVEKRGKNKWTLMLLILAIIFLAVIFFRFGLTIGFWITLALWVVFGAYCFLYCKTFFLFRIFLVVIFLFSFSVSLNVFPGLKTTGASGSLSNSSGRSDLVNCTGTLSSQPVSIPGYKMTLNAAGIDSTSTIDNGTRTFSLSALKSKSGGNDVFFRLATDPSVAMPGVKGLIEVCDANNMTSKMETTKDSSTTPAKDTTTAMIYYMHGGNYPHDTGEYRIDAYANVSGTWVLVGRMTGITITK
ncbi:MAG: YqaE/Pmp3 family membrane protein [Candidatus Berkelbacteria bacterium]|nr:YqaE/Pmp3 family membrane protein [Candidatus Berkelbacteria bacterium]